MANFIISDLFLNGSFFEELTEGELSSLVCGGASAAAAVANAGYIQRGSDINEYAFAASVSITNQGPIDIYAFVSPLGGGVGAS